MKIEERLSDAMHNYADSIEPDPGSWSRIAARFDEAPASARPPRGRLVLAGVAITLVVVLIAVLALRDDGGSNRVVTGPGAPAAPMPSRILAIAAGGAPVIVDSTTGQRLDGFGTTTGIVAGAQMAVAPDAKTAYVVTGNGLQGCADQSVSELSVTPTGPAAARFGAATTSPTVSPDGRYLAFLRCRPGDARAQEIVLHDRVTGAETATPAPTGAYFVNRLEFDADSRHVIVDLFEDARGTSTLREIDLVGGAAAPGRVLPIDLDTYSIFGRLGSTGTLLAQDPSQSPVRAVALSTDRAAPPRSLFTLPGRADVLASDASGRHVLAVVDHTLYRWSVGDEEPTKLFGNYQGAAWIPDAAQRSAGLPPGVAVAKTDGGLVSMDSATGAEHEALGKLPSRSSLIAIPPDGLKAVYGTVSKNGPCVAAEIGVVTLATGLQSRIVSGATSPIVSPDGRFVAYGIQCDGVTLGFSDLRNGENYRTDPFPANAGVPQAQGIDPIAWAPDAKRILYRAVVEGSEDPTYWIGRLWPLRDDTGGNRLPQSARFSAATFVTNRTLAIAADAGGRSRVRFVDLAFEPVQGEGFEVPGRIERLAVDPSGEHFLAVTLRGDLYRWSVGDPAPTKLAGGVSAASWLPWS